MKTSKICAVATAVLLAAASAGTQAESWFQFVAGVGASSAVKAGDEQYFDQGLPHSTPTDSFAARAGVVFNAIDAPVPSWVPGLRIHADYRYWGSLNWTATVAQDSSNFPNGNGGYSSATKGCIDGNCGQMRTFYSSGNTQSISLTAEAFWNVGHDWSVGIEAGPAIYFGPWTSTYVADESGPFGPAGSEQQVSHRVVPHIGAVVGLSVSHGPFSLSYNYLYAPPHFVDNGSDVPSGVRAASMLTIDYRF